MKANKLFLVWSFLFLAAQAKGQQEVSVTEKSPFTIGEIVRFKSTLLGEERQINVYLPNDYGSNTVKKYPVIYLFDGAVDQDFIHIAGIVQYASLPWISMIPESIVVGIVNIDRNKDYTPPTGNEDEKARFPTAGQSENFIKFISQELQPFIGKTYRTNDVKTLVGQSHGGLLATEILLKYPELFDNYIIVSPSLWWNEGQILDVQPKPYEGNKTVYLAAGSEGQLMEKMMDELYQSLWRVHESDVELYLYFFDEQLHRDVLHLAVYDSFGRIFRGG